MGRGAGGGGQRPTAAAPSTHQHGQLRVGGAQQQQAHGGPGQLGQGPAQRLAQDGPLAHEAQLPGGLRAGGVSAARPPGPPGPPTPGPALTWSSSRKSSEAARPRAAAPSWATCSKLVKRRGRPRTSSAHWRSAAPSWARRTRAAAAVSATSSHLAQGPGRAARARPSLRHAWTSATEK